MNEEHKDADHAYPSDLPGTDAFDMRREECMLDHNRDDRYGSKQVKIRQIAMGQRNSSRRVDDAPPCNPPRVR